MNYMEFENKCDFDMDKLLLTKKNEVFKILQNKCDRFVLVIPLEKVKNEQERLREEEEIKNCLVFKYLKEFFLESRLCRKHGTQLPRKKGKKGYILVDNWYFFSCTRESLKVLKRYPNIYEIADWIDIYFIRNSDIVLRTISHEYMCSGSKELFFQLSDRKNQQDFGEIFE